VSVEKYIDPSGLFVKLHDFNKQTSLCLFFKLFEELFEEIPNKEFDLIPNEMRNEMMDLLVIRNSILSPDDLVAVPRSSKLKEEKSMMTSDDEKTMYSCSSARNVFNVDKIFKEKSKGTLIYRDFCPIRCIFPLTAAIQSPPLPSPTQLSLNPTSPTPFPSSHSQREIL
jgi:hypothetical protein